MSGMTDAPRWSEAERELLLLVATRLEDLLRWNHHQFVGSYEVKKAEVNELADAIQRVRYG